MPVERGTMTPGTRYVVASTTGTSVRTVRSHAAEGVQRLPYGTTVLVAEAHDDGNKQWSRISSPAGWVSSADLAPADPIPSLRMGVETFRQRHLNVAPGDHYGLAFPFTLAMLRDFGADFLTAALRATGVLCEDNHVSKIVDLKHLGIPGASENAFLTLEYAKPDPSLSTNLFVKFPPESEAQKFLQSVMSYGEIAINRFSQRGTMPVPVARCYYADYCAETSN